MISAHIDVYLANQNSSVPVALPRRQPQPPPHCVQVRTCSSRRLCRISDCIRGSLLPLLHFVELVPASASCGCGWCGRIRQWKPRIGRGAGSPPGWSPLSVSKDASSRYCPFKARLYILLNLWPVELHLSRVLAVMISFSFQLNQPSRID